MEVVGYHSCPFFSVAASAAIELRRRGVVGEVLIRRAGEINVPIAIDGMVIEPGDLMLGDGDGTLCVPFAEAENICTAAEAKNAAEQVQMAEIEAGTLDRSWVDEALNRLGCEFP